MIILIIGLVILITILIVLILYYYYYDCYEHFEVTLPAPTYDPRNLLNLATTPPSESAYLNDFLLANTQELIPTTNEVKNLKPVNSRLNPVLAVASQTSLMNQLKTENNRLNLNNKEKRDELATINSELTKIKNEILEKEKEKLKLSADIADMKNMDTISKTVLAMIIKGIDATMMKEQQLRNYENELEEKKKKIENLLAQPAPKQEPVEIKESQIKPLKDKLKELESRFSEISNKIPDTVCKEKSMPEPQKEAFLNNPKITQNPSHNWCSCNDNKKSFQCTDYYSCSEHYLTNKDKKSLNGEDLTLYMKCLSKYPNFPKYLSENNK
jgi:hypothetical protein